MVLQIQLNFMTMFFFAKSINTFLEGEGGDREGREVRRGMRMK